MPITILTGSREENIAAALHHLKLSDQCEMTRTGERICEIAELYKDRLERERSSKPLSKSRKSLCKQLDDLERCVTSIETILPLLPYGAATFNPADGEDSDRRRQDEKKQTNLAERWQRSAKYGAEIVDLVRETRKRADNWAPGKTGRLNVYTNTYGPAKLSLVKDCYVLFEKHRPSKANATENGPFHVFCEDVCELATGKSATNAGLIRYVREVIKFKRNRKPRS